MTAQRRSDSVITAAAPAGPRVKRRRAREPAPKAAVPSRARKAPVRRAPDGLTRTETIRTREAAPDGRADRDAAARDVGLLAHHDRVDHLGVRVQVPERI